VISKEQNNIAAKVAGLVLAGGKSIRMGLDKGAILWHGKEQRYHMADLLRGICPDVYISCRQEQQSEIDARYPTLTDSFPGSGPIVAILSAFKKNPHAAWLVVACDLPLLDAATLQYLLQHRDPARIATTFQSPFDGLPEPLITIWEPSAYPLLETFLSGGYTCPRKALIRNIEQVTILTPPDSNALMNANTPEDMQKVKEILQKMPG
jgi:molybdenum cofactor guanylyltransferase